MRGRAAEWYRCELRIHYVNGHMFGPGPLYIKVRNPSDAEQTLHEFYQGRQDGVPIQSFSFSELIPLSSLKNNSESPFGVGAFILEDRIWLLKGQLPSRGWAELLVCLMYNCAHVVPDLEHSFAEITAFLGLKEEDQKWTPAVVPDWAWLFNDQNPVPEPTERRLLQWTAAGTVIYRATLGDWLDLGYRNFGGQSKAAQS